MDAGGHPESLWTPLFSQILAHSQRPIDPKSSSPLTIRHSGPLLHMAGQCLPPKQATIAPSPYDSLALCRKLMLNLDRTVNEVPEQPRVVLRAGEATAKVVSRREQT